MRLIDADKLNKNINNLGYMPVCVDCMTKHNIVEIIDAQPTVYDKTIEALKIGWIPCSERIPDESLNSVIGWDKERERCIFVQYLNGKFKLNDKYDSVNITHWMPVPEKP